MQPYYIYTTKTETTKYPIGWHAHNANKASYLELHLDIQLTWKQHIKPTIDKIRTKRREMYWPTRRNSKFSMEHKLQIYETKIYKTNLE